MIMKIVLSQRPIAAQDERELQGNWRGDLFGGG